jgi:hypothetical protein
MLSRIPQRVERNGKVIYFPAVKRRYPKPHDMNARASAAIVLGCIVAGAVLGLLSAVWR